MSYEVSKPDLTARELRNWVVVSEGMVCSKGDSASRKAHLIRPDIAQAACELQEGQEQPLQVGVHHMPPG